MGLAAFIVGEDVLDRYAQVEGEGEQRILESVDLGLAQGYGLELLFGLARRSRLRALGGRRSGWRFFAFLRAEGTESAPVLIELEGVGYRGFLAQGGNFRIEVLARRRSETARADLRWNARLFEAEGFEGIALGIAEIGNSLGHRRQGLRLLRLLEDGAKVGRPQVGDGKVLGKGCG